MLLADRNLQVIAASASNGFLAGQSVAQQTPQDEQVDLKASAASRSEVRGFLTEVADGVIGAVLYDYDATGRNIGRRMAGVATTGAQVGSHDVTNLIGENEPYPGVSRFN
jgi:hypothetical protein